MDCNFTNVIDLITDQQKYQLNLIAIKFRLDEYIWAKLQWTEHLLIYEQKEGCE